MRLQGHVGPHGEFYHGIVLERLSAAVAGKSGLAYRSALIEALNDLRYDIRYNGLDALLKSRASYIDVMGKF